MKLYTIPLVNWGMGSILIGVFVLVCIVMTLVVYNMVNTDKNKNNSDGTDS